MIEQNEMKVSGSPSYSDLLYLPTEACNTNTTHDSKFGGPVPLYSNFYLSYTLKQPILM